MFKNEGGGGVKGCLNNVKKKQTIWLGRASLNPLINPSSIRAELYKTEEEKRPGGKKTHSDLFGIEGSFRFTKYTSQKFNV